MRDDPRMRWHRRDGRETEEMRSVKAEDGDSVYVFPSESEAWRAKRAIESRPAGEWCPRVIWLPLRRGGLPAAVGAERLLPALRRADVGRA